MKLSYDSWLAQVRQLLWHPDAINCTADPRTLEFWHKAGFSPTKVATRLNWRWRVKQEVIAEAEETT